MEQLRGFQLATEAFCFNFSAFLSAARSITFVIQKMYRHSEGFEAEYQILRERLREIPLANEIIESRNVSEKEGHRVPLLITTIIDLDTRDRISYDCDPLPDDVNDVIRRVEFERGSDKEGWIPAGLSEQEKTALYTNQFLEALRRMQECENKITTYGIKLHNKGTESSLENFFENMDAYLGLLEEATVSFDRLWPSSTVFNRFGKTEGGATAKTINMT